MASDADRQVSTMFLGHFAIGFGAKPLAPRVSLGSLFFAAQWLDLLWPTLLLLGVEQVRVAPGATAVTPLPCHSCRTTGQAKR